MSEAYLPKEVKDTSVVCPSTPAGKGTRGVYTVVTDVESGRSYAVVGFRSYMQENVSDENRPNGHMTVEFLIDTSKQRTLPHNTLGQDNVQMLPFPCFYTWWRAILNGYKLATSFLQFGYVPSTGQDAILEQNVC